MTTQLPILFIPGLLCDARLFAHQQSAFGARALIANHQRGASVTECAQAILADAPPHFDLCGLSMGGYLAMEIMRLAPARVGRLVLMDTTARPDRPDQTEKRLRTIETTAAGKFDLALSLTTPHFVAAANRPRLQSVLDEMARATGPAVFMNQQRIIMSRPDSRPSLRQITVPALAVVGMWDSLTPVGIMAEIASYLPQATLAVVPGSGHLPPIEAPEATTALLQAFLG